MEETPPTNLEKPLDSNGAAVKAKTPEFKDPIWVKGTQDLKQFQKDDETDWDTIKV